MLGVHASTAQRSLEGPVGWAFNPGKSYHEPPVPSHPMPWWTLSGFIDRRRAARRVGTLCITVMKPHPVSYVCPAGVRVTCLAGTAWITTEADVHDVVLETGQAHDASRGARLFINGLPFCELRIAQHHDERQDTSTRSR